MTADAPAIEPIIGMEIHVQLAAINADLALNMQRLINAIDGEPVFVFTVGQVLNRQTHAPFRARDDFIGDGIQVIEGFFIHELEQLIGTVAVGRELGPDIAEGLIGLA